MVLARRTAGLVVLAMLLAGCGGEGDDEQVDTLARELEDARQEVDVLRDEVARLEAALEAAGDEEPPEDEPADDERPNGDPPTADDTPEPPPLWSAEGLNQQVRILLGWGVPEEFDPGTTEWQPFDPPDGLDSSYEDLGPLAADLLARLDGDVLGTDVWESTVRALPDPDDPDLGDVAVLSWGFADDAVIGRDVRMTVTRVDGGWEPGGAEARYHCARGVSDGLCL